MAPLPAPIPKASGSLKDTRLGKDLSACAPWGMVRGLVHFETLSFGHYLIFSSDTRIIQAKVSHTGPLTWMES